MLSPLDETARYALVHDVAKAGAADLVIGQQPAVVNQRKNREGGWSILGIAPRLELDHRGPKLSKANEGQPEPAIGAPSLSAAVKP